MKCLFDISEQQDLIEERIDELMELAEGRFEGAEADALALAFELVALVRQSRSLEDNIASIRETAEHLLSARCKGGPH